MGWAIFIFLLLVPALIVGGAILYARLMDRAGIDGAPPCDAVILAAHPDDCVIVAGEYAIRARAAGKRVRVVYLTCGDSSPATERAKKRRAEAIAAWGMIGVPETDLVFFDLPETPRESRSASYAPENRAKARATLGMLLQGLTEGTVVFIPAHGEIHPDHRELRSIALEAFRKVARSDVVLYESPEYHAYFSLTRSTARTLVYMLAAIPLVSRLVKREWARERPFFHNGGPGLMLAPDASRLEKKRAMLRAFDSENQDDIIVRLYGWPDLYRPVDLAAAAVEAEGKGYLKVGEKFLSPSILALWLSLWSVVLVLLFTAGQMKRKYFEGSHTAAVITAALGAVLLVLAFVRRHSTERRVTVAVCGMGLIAGAIAAEEFLIEFLFAK